MPGDVFSIEALIEIYEQVGDEAKLAELKGILSKVEKGEKLKPKTNSIKARTTSFSISVNTNKLTNRKVSLKARPAISDPVPPSWRRKNQELDQIKMTKALADLVFSLQYSLKSQVDLMVRLYDVDLLTKSQFSKIVYQLSEHKFLRAPVKPTMVVHMLEECPGVELDKVQYFLSRKSSLPYLDVSLMEFNDKLYSLLPETLIFNHGIVIFKKIGADFCIAVLNPLNSELMEKTAYLLGTNVHFFITSAKEFDEYVRKGAKQRS
ncbi:MAG: hypothetical protein NE328_09550 [Lentisphaeraceae bacterium]|nr:hypothetical protein [Lentisphaeraceae bacterium]